MDELVTVIIPVYNAYDYLERCVNTIINQTHNVLQIILIDDGSTDDSGDLCDTFAKNDKRIEVIHQINKGISGARNAGLDKARGEWITFVDSDDFVSRHYVEDMFAALNEDCDIVVCRYISVQNSTKETDVSFRRFSTVERITGYTASIRHFGKEADLLNTSWAKLFRARLWQTLRYPEGKMNEDVHVAHTFLYNAKNIAITNAVLYAYVQSEGSLMRTKFSIRNLDVVDAWQEAIRFFSKENRPEIVHIARRVYCCRIFDACCICKSEIPHESVTLNSLNRRAREAYREAKPIRGYIDCSRSKSFAYWLKLFAGHWCMPLYNAVFVRNRTYI